MSPIVVEFDVACSPEHAFDIWTANAALWWPRSHTLSHDSNLEVVFEPVPGGRIYEKGADGVVHLWGEVKAWDRPHRIECYWHIFFERSEATDVTVTFKETVGGTRVTLYQNGFDRLGDAVGGPRRDRTEGAWAQVTWHYRQAADVG